MELRQWSFTPHRGKTVPIPVATQSKVWAFVWALSEIVGSNPTWGMDVCVLWVFVGRQVQVSATD
jgi:hypothetical protein